MRFIWTVMIALAAVSGACERNRDRADAQRDAAGRPTAGNEDHNRVPRADRSFVRDVAIGNTVEIELSKLAPERSSNDDVKKFAQQMADDHTKSMKSLKAIADQYNIPVSADMDSRRTRLRDKLANARGNDFDRAYMDAIVDGHEEMLDKLESRVDEEKLAEYKTESSDKVAGTKTSERAEAVAVLPEKSDNAATTSLNQWAATTYPDVRTHLEAAKALKTVVDQRRADPSTRSR